MTPCACDKWREEPPRESGYYWHWNGDQDCAPIIVSVMLSGGCGKYFVARNFMDGAPNCEDVSGWWKLIPEEQVPDRQFLTAPEKPREELPISLKVKSEVEYRNTTCAWDLSSTGRHDTYLDANKTFCRRCGLWFIRPDSGMMSNPPERPLPTQPEE